MTGLQKFEDLGMGELASDGEVVEKQRRPLESSPEGEIELCELDVVSRLRGR